MNGEAVNESFTMPEDDVELIGSWSEYMPAGHDTDTASDGTVGLAVWDECVFEEGVSVQIETTDECSSVLRHLDLGDNLQIHDSLAFDITFLGDDESEHLQPYENRLVHIELEFPSMILGDRFYLVHQKENGQFEFIPDAEVSVRLLDDGKMQATGVSFDGTSFSVYALISANESGRFARRTYEFFADGILFAAQTVTKEDYLADPGIPELPENEEFLGWYRTGDENRKPVTIAELRNELFDADIYEGETVSLTAIVRQTHTVSFVDEENSLIMAVKVCDGEDFAVSESYEPKHADFVFLGWNLDEEYYAIGEIIHNVSCDLVLKPSLKRTFLLTFQLNSDDETVPEIPPVAAEEGTDLSLYLPDSEWIVRPGYIFAGWYGNSGH